MSIVTKFGEIRDPDNETVFVELFGPGRSEDFVSTGLRLLTHQLQLLSPETTDPAGFFGGSFGYGANYENGEFLMHPYCWCEKQGECPWCTGCAIYQETNQCRACSEMFPHSPNCYQTEMNQARKVAGLSYILDDKFVHVSDDRPWKEKNKIENVIYTKFCSNHGLDRKLGCAVHCDCGADESRKKAIEDRGCDYRFGRGIFARFHPYVLDHQRHYYDPPNFWHKSTNFRVTWYKYIGRDNVFNRDITSLEWRTILESTLVSIGGPSFKDAVEAFVRAEAADL